jgi:hypothetical protein
MKVDVKKRLGDKYNVVFSDIEQSVEKINVDKINNKYLSNSTEKVSVQGGYPTLYKIVGGKLEYFGGARRADEMTNWFSVGLGKQTAPRNNVYNSSVHKQTSHNATAPKLGKKSYYDSFMNMVGGKNRKTKKNRKSRKSRKSRK